MTRRALTLLLASALALGLAITGSVVTVPYVALKPGPAFNTLGSVDSATVITVQGAHVHERDGALDLTTVSVADRISLFEAIAGWLSPNEAVLPREIVIPPDQTPQQTNRQNAQEMTDSQDAATAAALTELGYKGRITVYVTSLADKAPAQGKLAPGDVITAVDHTAITGPDQLRKLISARQPGQSVLVSFTRDGKPHDVTIVTTSTTDGAHRAIVGALLGTRTEFPVKVAITLRDVGGPSAGLMFALGIIDKLGPVSLTGGRKIAGTGEIAANGDVSPIGGIAQKMRGAKAVGATVFLSPTDNCDEARKTRPDGITLVRVTSLRSALAALQLLRDGGTPPSC